MGAMAVAAATALAAAATALAEVTAAMVMEVWATPYPRQVTAVMVIV